MHSQLCYLKIYPLQYYHCTSQIAQLIIKVIDWADVKISLLFVLFKLWSSHISLHSWRSAVPYMCCNNLCVWSGQCIFQFKNPIVGCLLPNMLLAILALLYHQCYHLYCDDSYIYVLRTIIYLEVYFSLDVKEEWLLSVSLHHWSISLYHQGCLLFRLQ